MQMARLGVSTGENYLFFSVLYFRHNSQLAQLCELTFVWWMNPGSFRQKHSSFLSNEQAPPSPTQTLLLQSTRVAEAPRRDERWERYPQWSSPSLGVTLPILLTTTIIHSHNPQSQFLSKQGLLGSTSNLHPNSFIIVETGTFIVINDYSCGFLSVHTSLDRDLSHAGAGGGEG